MKKNRASRAKAWALFFCLLLAVFGPNLLSRSSQKVNHLEDDFQGCTNSIAEEVPSPGGIYVATLFERDCGGAASDLAPRVILKRSPEKFKESNYIDHPEDIVYNEIRWTGSIRLKWKTDNYLVIDVPEKSKQNFVQEARWQDVRISFR